MSEFEPIPDPAGSLDPPPRKPPTAVAAATPEPEPEPEPEGQAGQRARPRRATGVLTAALQLAIGIPLLALEYAEEQVRKLVKR